MAFRVSAIEAVSVGSVRRVQRGFTLVEVLVVAGIVAVVAALLYPVVQGALKRAARADAVSNMRAIGVAMQLFSTDHAGMFVGPLWPGQVTEYDRDRAGRLVRDLAPYLGIEDRTPPYVVQRFLPAAAKAALPGVQPKDIRVYVMNMLVPSGGEVVNPWGSLAGTPTLPLPVSRLQAANPRAWAMSEAYQTHPAVVSAPWKMNTPPAPLFGDLPLGLFFDGSVATYDPAVTQ